MSVSITIALLLLMPGAFGQSDTLIFTNYGTPVPFGKDRFYSSKIHQIILNPNSTFEFWSHPHVSCLTWRQYKGTWKRYGDTLAFSDKYEIEEENSKATYKNDSRQSFLISCKTDKGSVLKNRKIKVQFEYDYDAHLDEPEQEFSISSDNTLEIPFKRIPNIRKLSAISIEYELDFKKKRYNYLTKNNPLNNKKIDVPNVINVEFIEDPQKEIVYRTIKGVINKNSLIIISVSKSKTKMTDYYPDIEFEKGYSLEK